MKPSQTRIPAAAGAWAAAAREEYDCWYSLNFSSSASQVFWASEPSTAASCFNLLKAAATAATE